MTIQQVVDLLEKEYEAAKKKEFVQYPLAYALYQTWKKVDKRRIKR